MAYLRRTIGVLGVLVACGPSAPQDPAESEGTSDPGPGPGTSGDTGEPGTETGEPPPTSTQPEPACMNSYDCGDLYCGYCEDGVCVEGLGCCGLQQGGRPDMQRLRCGQSYDCYEHEDCPEGEVCKFGSCFPFEPRLPPCADPGAIVGQWLLGADPGAFALADLDGDGDLDLAATQPAIGRIELAFNDGFGGFMPGGSVEVGPGGVHLALAAGDLDGDGDVDLAAVRAAPDGGLVLVFGQDAVFTPQPTLPTPPGPARVFIAPVDGDASADVVVVLPDGVETRPGDGVGGLGEPLGALALTIDPRASLVDVDADGRLDLIAALPATTVVGMWTGDGEGRFIPHVSIDTLLDQVATLAAPLDPADGRPSLVFARTVAGVGQVEAYAPVDSPMLYAAPVQRTASLPISGATLAELDEPAGPDLLAATGEPRVLVVLGDADGGFSCERIVEVDGPTDPNLLVAGDLDGNGRVDIIAGDPGQPVVTVVLTQ